jgi:hypothetical protein
MARFTEEGEVMKTTEELKQDYLDAASAAYAVADSAATAAYTVSYADAAYAAATDITNAAYKLWQDALKKEKS